MIIRLFFLLIFSINAYGSGIHVSLNHNPVSLNDSFDIIFTANDEPDGEPDFSPLETDFSIVTQSQRNSASWINGKSSSTKQWVITVIAKQAGNLIIPSVRFGHDVSETATVLVTQGSATGDTNEELFLKTDVSTQTPYIQSQVLYKVRLFTRVSIAQAQLTEPELSDALIEKIGEDSNYSTQINGVDYSVTERNYALFPQKSGSMLIKPLSLTAEVVSGRSNINSFFFNSQSSQTKRVQSKEIELKVQPVPASFKAKPWLSAEQLELKQQWSADIAQMKVGEPLTRTLSVLAKGTTVGSLPELNRGELADGLKAYPDQPVLKENKPVDGVIAFREEKIALIPAKAGSYTLPAIEITWFNTKTGQIEVAKIPATQLTAVGGVATTPVAPVTESPKASSTITEPTKLTPPVQTESAWQNAWLWLALFFALGWLATLFYFLKHRLSDKTASEQPTAEELSLKAATQQLKIACQNDNPEQAKAALLAWGKLVFAAPHLDAIALRVDNRLQAEILALNAALYSQQRGQWQGKKLFQAFSEYKAITQLKTLKSDELQPLYRL